MKFLSYFLSYFSLCLLVVNFPHFPHSQWRYCSDFVLASGLSLFVDVHEILMDHHCLQRLFFVLWHFWWHSPVATATNWKSFTLIKFVIFILMLLIFFQWKWLFSPSNTRELEILSTPRREENIFNRGTACQGVGSGKNFATPRQLLNFFPEIFLVAHKRSSEMDCWKLREHSLKESVN